MADEKPDIFAIFNEAVERETNDERSRYLDEACQNDPAIRERVESLLRAHSNPQNFLGDEPPGIAATIDQPAVEQAGSMIGPYKLIEEIGEGGMGLVYMARQETPVKRIVALKVIKPGMDSRQVIAVFSGHDDDIQDMAFHPTAPLLASSDRGGVIRTWTLDSTGETGSIINVTKKENWPSYFRGHRARAWTIEFSPDGRRVISAGKDGTVRAWTGHKRPQQELEDAADANYFVFSRYGDELIIPQPGGWVVWNRRTHETQAFHDLFTEEALSVAVSPDGAVIATGHREGALRFWNSHTREMLLEVVGHDGDIDHLEFSPDGALLATASWDGTGKLWNVDSMRELAVFDMPPHCLAMAFSPDGKLLAFSSEDNAMLFEVESRRRLYLLQGHQNTFECVAFSPDSRLLATGSHDRTIRIWDVRTGKTLHLIAAHRNKISAIAFSPDGRTIASGDMMGAVAFSHVPTGQFLFDLDLTHVATRRLLFLPGGETLAIARAGVPTMLLHAPPTDTESRNRVAEAENEQTEREPSELK